MDIAEYQWTVTEGRFWRWNRPWGQVLGEDQRTKFKVWCGKWGQVFKTVKQKIKRTLGLESNFLSPHLTGQFYLLPCPSHTQTFQSESKLSHCRSPPQMGPTRPCF